MSLSHKSATRNRVIAFQDLNASILEVKRLKEEASRSQMECDKTKKELSRAVLIAAEEIEERLAAAWEKEHFEEVKGLEVCKGHVVFDCSEKTGCPFFIFMLCIAVFFAL